MDPCRFAEGHFQFLLCELSKILMYLGSGSCIYERGVSPDILLLDEEAEFAGDDEL